MSFHLAAVSWLQVFFRHTTLATRMRARLKLHNWDRKAAFLLCFSSVVVVFFFVSIYRYKIEDYLCCSSSTAYSGQMPLSSSNAWIYCITHIDNVCADALARNPSRLPARSKTLSCTIHCLIEYSRAGDSAVREQRREWEKKQSRSWVLIIHISFDRASDWINLCHNDKM